MNASEWIRDVTDKVTNVVMNYTETEAKVREATNDDPWGPAGSLMLDIAHDTYIYESFPDVMGMLWYRIFHEGDKHWRRIYKSLLLLSYLLHYGSEHVVNNTRNRIRRLKKLEIYTYIENGKDEGINIRKKVKEILALVQDTERLREERKRAKATQYKFVGLSSEDARRGSWKRRTSFSTRKDSFESERHALQQSSKSSFSENTNSTPSSSKMYSKDNSRNSEVDTFQQKQFGSDPIGSRNNKIDLGATKSYAGQDGNKQNDLSVSRPETLIDTFTDLQDVFRAASQPPTTPGQFLDADFGQFQSGPGCNNIEDPFLSLACSKPSPATFQQPQDFSPNTSLIPPTNMTQPVFMPAPPQNQGNFMSTIDHMTASAVPNSPVLQPQSSFYPMQSSLPTSSFIESQFTSDVKPLYGGAPPFPSPTRSPSVDPPNKDTPAKSNIWSNTQGIDINVDSLWKNKANSFMTWNRKPDGNSSQQMRNTNQQSSATTSLNQTTSGFPGAPNNLMYSPPAMMSPMINRSPFTVPAMVPTNPQTRNYYSSGQYGAGFR